MSIDDNLLSQWSLQFIDISANKLTLKYQHNILVKQVQYCLLLYLLEPKHSSHEDPG